MKKFSVLAILAIAMVSVSSAFTSGNNACTMCGQVSNDTVVTSCQSTCQNAAKADTVQTQPNDSVR